MNKPELFNDNGLGAASRRARFQKLLDQQKALFEEQEEIIRELTAAHGQGRAAGEDPNELLREITLTNGGASGPAKPDPETAILPHQAGSGPESRKSAFILSGDGMLEVAPFTFQTASIWQNDKAVPDHRVPSFEEAAISAEDAAENGSKENLEEMQKNDVKNWKDLCPEFPLEPTSVARSTWDIMALILLTWDIFFIPFQAFEPDDTTFTDCIGWLSLIYWTLDIVMSNVTGFYEKGTLVASQKRITLQWLKTWAVLDIIVVGPDWFMKAQAASAGGASQSEGASQQGADAAELLKSARILRVLRLVRVLKMKRLLNIIYDAIDSEYMFIIFAVVKLIVFIMVLNHVIACIWYLTGKMTRDAGESNWLDDTGLTPFIHGSLEWRYLTALHWSLTQFTPASMEVFPRNVGERLVSVIVLLLALITFSSILSSIANAMTALRNMGADTKKQFWLLRRFFKQNSVDPKARERIVKFLEHQTKTGTETVNQNDIKLLSLLSEPLQNLLLYELNRRLIIVHPLFDHLESNMVSLTMKVCRHALSSIFFASDDVIFSPGDEAILMFFVKSGELKYVLERNVRNVTSISTGTWLAEPVLWTDWWNRGELRAIYPSSMSGIKAGPFAEVMRGHPQQWEVCRKYAAKFVSVLNSGDPLLLDDLSPNGKFLSSTISECDKEATLERAQHRQGMAVNGSD